MLGNRYAQASVANLGTEKDILEIRQLIHQNFLGYSVTEIRWISATKAIALIELKKGTYASFYCAFKKQSERWVYITSYLGTVS